jgi:hypothetical protein
MLHLIIAYHKDYLEDEKEHGQSRSIHYRWKYNDILSHPDLKENPNAKTHVRQDQVSHMRRLNEYQKHSVKA